MGPRRKSFMHSMLQFLEIPFTPLLLQRTSKSVSVSKNRISSLASFNRIEVLEMEMRRTNPGFIGKAKMNTIKITKALVGAFLACWTPYYVMCIWWVHDRDIVPEIIDSGPMCITDLFQNKYLAYFNPKWNTYPTKINFFSPLCYITF